MICFEVKFDSSKKFELEMFLLKTRVLFFDQCYDEGGCLRLYLAERDRDLVKRSLKRCAFVDRVRNISIDETDEMFV